MAKKQPVLIHPLTIVDAITEYHNRVGMLLMAVHTAIEFGNLPEPVKAKLREASDSVRECWRQP